MDTPDLASLLTEVDRLRAQILSGAAPIAARWQDWIEAPGFAPSAESFAQYLALRQHDIRPLQWRLMQAGLSSLGRAESRVLPTLEATRALLAAAQGAPYQPPAPDGFLPARRALPPAPNASC